MVIKKKVKKSEFKGKVCNFLGSLIEKNCYTHKYTLIRV